MPERPTSPWTRLPPRDEKSGDTNIVVETPRGSQHKFTLNREAGVFELSTTLPSGSVFPYDFGFIPGTLGDDGDPLDVLILMDQPAFAGCLVKARLIGVIEADQTEDGETARNDRLIAVAAGSHTHAATESLKGLGAVLEDIERFFVNYCRAHGKTFTPLGIRGPRRAAKLLVEGAKRAERQRPASPAGRTRVRKHPKGRARPSARTAS